MGMGRSVLLLASLALTVLLVGGVALADTIKGTPGGDYLLGTNGSDMMNGRGGGTHSLVAMEAMSCAAEQEATT
jgi:hypothetical protein